MHHIHNSQINHHIYLCRYHHIGSYIFGRGSHWQLKDLEIEETIKRPTRPGAIPAPHLTGTIPAAEKGTVLEADIPEAAAEEEEPAAPAEALGAAPAETPAVPEDGTIRTIGRLTAEDTAARSCFRWCWAA